MACRAAWQRSLNGFQMVLQQNAAIVGDAVANSKDSKRGYERVNKLVIILLA